MWPEIRKMLEVFLLDLISSIFQSFKDYMEKNSQQQSNKAKEKAKEAEQRAKEATNPDEVMKYRAREEAFNEMYEELRLSHDKMNKELDELKTKFKISTEKRINNLSAENVFENTGNGIDIKYNPMLLPPNEE